MRTTVHYSSRQGFHISLADAYEAVAKANHYMVGVLMRDDITPDAFDAAEQILICRQNNTPQHARAWKRLELALDTLAYDRNRLRPGRVTAREMFADYGSPAREG